MTRRTRSNPFTTVGDLPAINAFTGVLTHLSHNYSTVLQGVGDSTVVGFSAAAPWTAYIADRLGAYYDANVWMCAWNDTNQSYDPPTVRRVSSLGERTKTVPVAGGAYWMTYTAPNVTGDIEITMKLTPTSWASGAAQQVLSKWANAGNQRGFSFQLGASGALVLQWTQDGITGKVATSTANVGFTAGNPGWVRVTLQVDNGASGYTAKFYTSTDGTTWTQLGTTITVAGVTSIFASSAKYQLWGFAGTYTWVQVRNALTNGVDMVPMLPDKWGQSSNMFTIVPNGGPCILLMNGGASTKDVPWFDDPVRQPKVLTPTSDVILIGLGINDTLGTFDANLRVAAERYLTFVRHVKSLRPAIPIVVTTQNPVAFTGTQTSYLRAGSIATALALEPGVAVLDTYQAYVDLSTQIVGDGVHPSTAGQQAQADWMLRRLAPKTVL